MEELHRDIKRKKSLYDEAKELRPMFSSNTEAINAYTKELEALSKKYGMTPKELIIKVETEDTFNEELLTVLSLTRKIQMLKRL